MTKREKLDKYLASRLRVLRARAGVSQQKLGDDLGVTFQQIQKYEQGKNRFSASSMYLMADVMGVDYQEFFNEWEGK